MPLTRPAFALSAALFLALTGVAHADLTPMDGYGTTRIGGDDRYDVAANVSDTFAAPPQEIVYVVSGEVFADALAAGPIAYADNAPILLTEGDELSAAAEDQLVRLSPALVRVVGGTSTIRTAVLRRIEEVTGAEVERVAGVDRYDLAAGLLTERGPVDTVFLVSGEVFSDALSAGPAAALVDGAIALTRDDALPEATAAALLAADPARVIAVGGPVTINSEVLWELGDLLPDADVSRIRGNNRYDVSINVAQEFWQSGATTAFLASGEKYPDALSGTPAAGVHRAPILLTKAECHPYETVRALTSLSPDLRVVLGGKLSASDAEDSCGPKPSYPFPPGDRDCHDWPTQEAVHEWFAYWYPKVGDIYDLDGNNDGEACEVW